MVGIEIKTSKKGRLWPTGYYKVLIDALTRGGAKHNPIEKYPELANVLKDYVCERGGRFYPTDNSPLSRLDDVALDAIIIHRVEQDEEGILIGPVKNLQTDAWHKFTFDFFGTIGSSKAETQSKQNRQSLELEAASILVPHVNCVSLSFQLRIDRKNKDLDNLADPLIPFFNAYIQSLDYVCVFKEPILSTQGEILRLSQAQHSVWETEI